MPVQFQSPNSNFRVETTVDKGLLFFWVLTINQDVTSVVPLQVGTGATELTLLPGQYQFQWQVNAITTSATKYSVTVIANKDVIHATGDRTLEGPVDFAGDIFIINY